MRVRDVRRETPFKRFDPLELQDWTAAEMIGWIEHGPTRRSFLRDLARIESLPEEREHPATTARRTYNAVGR